VLCVIFVIGAACFLMLHSLPYVQRIAFKVTTLHRGALEAWILQ